ncbi:MAG: PKD domain-containing protein [Saprospiraceae bacterium]|nr:PKD domain-containing protein [Saprospiraceae bacterium]
MVSLYRGIFYGNMPQEILLFLIPRIMKILSIFHCMFFFLLAAYGQKHDYVWLLGGNNQTMPEWAGTTIDFYTDPPDLYYEFKQMYLRQANASMCDTAGNLLFYTNGIYIANALHEPMENGAGLNPGALAQEQQNYGYILSQGALALPMPEHDSLYYLLHMDRVIVFTPISVFSQFFYFSLINMNSNNGLGRVEIKNMVILNEQLHNGKIIATKHANGRDWWLLIRKYWTNQYYRILLTPAGLSIVGIQIVGSEIPSNSIGQATFSPDGSKYANVHVTGVVGDPIYVSIYNFDRCTGELSNPVQFTYADNAACAGIAISPNNRFLYVSSRSYVYQYDLHADDIEASRITVAVYDGYSEPISQHARTTFYLAQLAPDGKIYINSNNTVKHLHVINNPDSLGLACDVCQHCVELPTYNSFSLPNFPNYRLHHLEGSPCDTLRQPPVAEWQHEPLGLEVGFHDASYHDIRAWHWSFGDGATDTVPNPVHSYAAEGVYNVCLSVSNPRGADTLCRELQVLVSSAGFDSAQPATAVRVEIWPNPVPSNVPATLVAENLPATEVTGTLRDALGRTVLRFTAQVVNGRIRQDLDVSGLAAGVYFYELVSPDGLWLGGGKLVIVR